MVEQENALIARLNALYELQFELAAASTTDDICLRAVTDGREPVGVDRMGIWFQDPDEPGHFIGTYGIDESGSVRDERSSRIPRNPDIFDDAFFERRIPFRLFPDTTVYDDRNAPVGTADLVVAPLWNGKESIGALCADNYASGRAMSAFDTHLVTLLARMVAQLVTMKRTEQELRRNARQLELLATTDELTGVLNRRTGMQVLEHQISLARRTGSGLTVCFLDLDGLKRINDTQGHGVGDRFIQVVVSLVERELREADIVCRMGGDEFMVVLPGSDLADAERVMERVTAVASRSGELAAITPGPWFSYGFAHYDGRDDAQTRDDAESLVHAADVAMYQHKRGKEAGD
ncbi:MAG: sensor domain-containing diguanylate cyclase [Spirochaeta sp.]|jgi:diguanylate cyclase (GGDEF)-like protein|nr:sensor domain-containing diguanylate cyclase [Spirochaeta sp.]